MIRKKGVYIVSETGSLRQGSGAKVHINTGLIELNKYFSVKQVLFCKGYRDFEHDKRKRVNRNGYVKRFIANLKRPLAWSFLLVKNHFGILHHYRRVRNECPDFIYERAAYLNYNGLIIAKLLKIPHVYEVNGIAAHDNSKFFPSFCNRLAFRLESMAYRRSDFGFYVGGLNEYFNIPKGKFAVVQNGIDEQFALNFKSRVNTIGDKINIVFVGHAMDHHRLDILFDSLHLVHRPDRFTLHLIGPDLEEWNDRIPSSIDRKYYGVLTSDQIMQVINVFNIGIIPYARDYFSNVKIFMYGAAKLGVILPSVKNFRSIFSADEVFFVSNSCKEDIADKLNYIAEHPGVLETQSERLYSKVIGNFTWNKIFLEVAKEIDQLLIANHNLSCVGHK